MGHDITAYLSTSTEPVAHLRMTAKAGRVAGIYKALGVPEFNNIDSGTGDSKVFTAFDLLKARGYYTVAEAEFISKCIRLSGTENIKITFA